MVTALARRQLFSAGMDPSGVSVLSVVPPAATAITFSPMKSGSGILSPMRPGGVMASPMKGGLAASRGGGRSKRTGSLSLFLRKVYNLAHLRLETLCNSMQVIQYLIYSIPLQRVNSILHNFIFMKHSVL